MINHNIDSYHHFFLDMEASNFLTLDNLDIFIEELNAYSEDSNVELDNHVSISKKSSEIIKKDKSTL